MVDKPPGRKVHVMSWEDYARLEQNIVESLREGFRWIASNDIIIGIYRGGIILARSLASKLGKLPMVIMKLCKESETTCNFFGDIGIIHLHENQKHKGRVLLVDDIADSGKTFARARAILENHGFSNVITATIIQKQSAAFLTDYHGRIDETSDWIRFPWE